MKNAKEIALVFGGFILGIVFFELKDTIVSESAKTPVKESVLPASSSREGAKPGENTASGEPATSDGRLTPEENASSSGVAGTKKDRFWRRGSPQDLHWAKEILKGGYILHFRHAHRDMDNRLFGDTAVFDAIDIYESFLASATLFR